MTNKSIREFKVLSRRGFITSTAAGLFVFTSGIDAFADELMRTPPMTEGPFYPDKMPLDKDNDLIIIGKNLTPALGTIAHVRGRILDSKGNPVRNAIVEIWQCDANAVYLHTKDSIPKAAQQDKNFQGFGTFETDSKGNYYFRTIKPIPYPGRPAPHIHFKVKKGDKELLTTQLMMKGYAGNSLDGVYRDLKSDKDKELAVTAFNPMKNSKIGEVTANWDIVLGQTLNEIRG